MRAITANGAYVTTLSPAFGTGQELCGEERSQAGGTEENGVRASDVLFEHTIVFAMIGAYDAEAEFFIGGPKVCPFRCCVDFAHELECAG